MYALRYLTHPRARNPPPPVIKDAADVRHDTITRLRTRTAETIAFLFLALIRRFELIKCCEMCNTTWTRHLDLKINIQHHKVVIFHRSSVHFVACDFVLLRFP